MQKEIIGIGLIAMLLVGVSMTAISKAGTVFMVFNLSYHIVMKFIHSLNIAGDRFGCHFDDHTTIEHLHIY